ncbi:unnamed protein product [Penicillium camemberti]|uniref:Str. FM013 n=1 Tax=Penicillium camemberti (strain FM 013) TaxID=1429867 RepID=A0A0G4PPF1_PENC3|nr:unnamed protein product [Penicillium camemberti]
MVTLPWPVDWHISTLANIHRLPHLDPLPRGLSVRRRNRAISIQDFLSKNTVSMFCTHVVVIQDQTLNSKRQTLLNPQDPA